MLLLLHLLRLLRLLLEDRLLGDLRRPARLALHFRDLRRTARLALHFRDLRRAARLALHRRGCDLRRAARLALDGTVSASLDQLIYKLFERGEEYEQTTAAVQQQKQNSASRSRTHPGSRACGSPTGPCRGCSRSRS